MPSRKGFQRTETGLSRLEERSARSFQLQIEQSDWVLIECFVFEFFLESARSIRD